jgi:catechol 2,3-dioxygenase-like lactoylglutathione lyase family enzyme
MPHTGRIDHVILTVNDLNRSRPFYTALMAFLGYGATWDYDGTSVGYMSGGGSFWIRQADARYVGESFCKDRVGLCEVAFRADSRDQVEQLARQVVAWGGAILHAPREYPEYVAGYYAVFFTDPDGIKLELVHFPE